MFPFGSPAPKPELEPWHKNIDRFTQAHGQELGAIAWLFHQEWQDEPPENRKVLGIDLKPQGHFVACNYGDLLALNRQVQGHLQEALGIIDGAKPEEEAVIMAIGNGQMKLLNFQPPAPPPDCAIALGLDFDQLVEQLEAKMKEFDLAIATTSL